MVGDRQCLVASAVIGALGRVFNVAAVMARSASAALGERSFYSSCQCGGSLVA